MIQIQGTWNLIGCLKDQYDDLSFDENGLPKGPNISSGVVLDGPVDGARVDVRIQNAGYKMPDPKEFSFEVSDDLTIMQDALSSRGGRRTLKGSIYQISPNLTADPNMERAGIYAYKDASKAPKGVPAAQALAAGQISPLGQLQLVTYVIPPNTRKRKFYTQADVPALLTEIRGNTAKLDELSKRQVMVATEDKILPSEFGASRQIDMSKDPKMYSFKANEYDLIVSFNPRMSPDFVQDRMGWSGEGITDKRYLRDDVKTGLRMLYLKIKLSKEDILGTDKKVLFDDSAGIGLDKLQK